jgi:2'-5' RNA ligase
MRLFAAIVPPQPALEDLTRVVRSVAVAPAPEPRRLFRRSTNRGAHAAGRPAPVSGVTKELAATSVATMHLPISGFGNVTLGDAKTLADQLRAEVATWQCPTLRLAGGTALEFPGDESVWAKLDGDLELLSTIGRGVPTVVQRLGFFVDRRQFRPWLSVGTITEETTAPYLERLVGSLESYRGEAWTVSHVSLMRRPNEAKDDQFEEMDRMPLAAPGSGPG